MIPFQFGFFRLLGEIIPTCWYNFDGVNEYIEVLNDESLNFERTDSFSSSIWVKFNNNDINNMIGKYNGTINRGWVFTKHTGNIIRLSLQNNGTSNWIDVRTNGTVSPDIWYNITFTYDGSTTIVGTKIYIDGVLQTYSSQLNNLTNTILNSSDVKIGVNDTVRYLNGSIDEVTIYNNELSQQDVTDIYSKGRTLPDLTTIDSYVQNCVSHWRMGENDEYYDYLSFDGINEYVTVVDDATLDLEYNTAYSIFSWVYINTGALTSTIVSKRSGATNYRGYVLRIRDTGDVEFISRNISSNVLQLKTTSTITYDAWNLIGITKTTSSDVSGVTLYINNSAQSTTTVSNTLSSTVINSNNFQIGRDEQFGVYLDGLIDETSIYNTELTQLQVIDIYNRGRSNPDLSDITGIVSHWKMDNSVTVLDQIGSNDGTTVNMDSSNLTTEWNIHDEVRREWTTFDGINEQTTFTSEVITSQELAMSFWINPNSLGDSFPLGNTTTSNKSIGVYIFSGDLLFVIGDGTNDSFSNSKVSTISNYLTIGEWSHVLCTWDGTDAKIYIDDVLRNTWSPTLPYTLIYDSTVFRLASRGSFYFNGNLDEVSLYNDGLTSTQVTDIYERGRNSPDYSDITGIVSHWKMDSLNPIDQIGSNNGTSINQDSTNLLNDINDGSSVNMDENNRICE